MSIPKLITVNKPVGLTPLQSLDKLRELKPELKNAKLSYSGRLDPMASGLMLVLVGDEVHNREHYQNLDKTYQVDILFGLETDTYDALGILKSTIIKPLPKDLRSTINDQRSKLIGAFNQPYPPYSYIKTGGHPLWWWAREGRLDEITIPSKSVTIHSAKLIDFSSKPLSQFVADIIRNINKVTGDFRQAEIIKRWQDLNTSNPNTKLPIATLKLSVSSGTYIRSIAHQLGQTLGTGALALHIHRTRVGEYTPKDSLTRLD